ncbi:10-epi-juneol synthase-like [Rutidosis leptorrhynchoides]|uniref:10-epi-juneol synthase-like n=1 Tax=Rutidosis leptorrhynchoides TaxID=125765 RepID=UPI003A9946E2
MVISAMKANSENFIRPLANFPRSMWGDRFLAFSLDKSELKIYAKATEEPKEEVKRLINDQTIDPNAKLSLIYSVYRLGLRYLFIEEIDSQLHKLFKDLTMEDYEETTLYTMSINFHVFRQHGYKVSCDVFKKFKDYSSGKFKDDIKSDVRGILSLYEAAQLSIHGESILDEALVFAKAQLTSVVDTLESDLVQQVKHALIIPSYRGVQMIEARLYFANYREECCKYNSLQKLANAHFNYLQLLQKEELRIVTQWAKDMEFQIITPYARDRVPELYLWTLAIYLEPHYSQGRIMVTKIAQLITVFNDTYDAYATIHELRLLTDAVNRWELSAIDQLPDNIKPLYKALLDTYADFEEQLSKEGRASRVHTSKRTFQELARGYHQEAEWRHNLQVPSFDDYIENGLITSTYNVFSVSFLMGMGDIVNEEVVAWYESHPKILKALDLLGRLYNDVTSFKFERQRAQKQITSVDAYMNTFGVEENEAVDEIKKMLENAWKDINEECLKPTKFSMEILSIFLNLARMTDFVYRYMDTFTFPEKSIAEYITLLFVGPVAM